MERGNTLGCWKTIPTRMRSSTGSIVPWLMSSPSSVMVPPTSTFPSMSFMRFRQRSSVDLPQPEGPMSAVTWLGAIPAQTPATAVSPE